MAVTRQPNAIKMTAAADSITGRFKVWALVWTGATAATDDLIIQCTGAVEVLAIKAGVPLRAIIYNPFGPDKDIDGIIVATMTAGTVTFILA